MVGLLALLAFIPPASPLGGAHTPPKKSKKLGGAAHPPPKKKTKRTGWGSHPPTTHGDCGLHYQQPLPITCCACDHAQHYLKVGLLSVPIKLRFNSRLRSMVRWYTLAIGVDVAGQRGGRPLRLYCWHLPLTLRPMRCTGDMSPSPSSASSTAWRHQPTRPTGHAHTPMTRVAIW